MTDPFAAALDALFAAPGAVAARYESMFGPTKDITVVRTIREADLTYGDTTVPVAAAGFDIRRCEVGKPVAGATIYIGQERFVIVGQPRLDVEGVTWHCEAPPAT